MMFFRCRLQARFTLRERRLLHVETPRNNVDQPRLAGPEGLDPANIQNETVQRAQALGARAETWTKGVRAQLEGSAKGLQQIEQGLFQQQVNLLRNAPNRVETMDKWIRDRREFLQQFGIYVLPVKDGVDPTTWRVMLTIMTPPGVSTASPSPGFLNRPLAGRPSPEMTPAPAETARFMARVYQVLVDELASNYRALTPPQRAQGLGSMQRALNSAYQTYPEGAPLFRVEDSGGRPVLVCIDPRFSATVQRIEPPSLPPDPSAPRVVSTVPPVPLLGSSRPGVAPPAVQNAPQMAPTPQPQSPRPGPRPQPRFVSPSSNPRISQMVTGSWTTVPVPEIRYEPAEAPPNAIRTVRIPNAPDLPFQILRYVPGLTGPRDPRSITVNLGMNDQDRIHARYVIESNGARTLEIRLRDAANATYSIPQGSLPGQPPPEPITVRIQANERPAAAPAANRNATPQAPRVVPTPNVTSSTVPRVTASPDVQTKQLQDRIANLEVLQKLGITVSQKELGDLRQQLDQRLKKIAANPPSPSSAPTGPGTTPATPMPPEGPPPVISEEILKMIHDRGAAIIQNPASYGSVGNPVTIQLLRSDRYSDLYRINLNGSTTNYLLCEWSTRNNYWRTAANDEVWVGVNATDPLWNEQYISDPDALVQANTLVTRLRNLQRNPSSPDGSAFNNEQMGKEVTDAHSRRIQEVTKSITALEQALVKSSGVQADKIRNEIASMQAILKVLREPPRNE